MVEPRSELANVEGVPFGRSDPAGVLVDVDHSSHLCLDQPSVQSVSVPAQPRRDDASRHHVLQVKKRLRVGRSSLAIEIEGGFSPGLCVKRNKPIRR